MIPYFCPCFRIHTQFTLPAKNLKDSHRWDNYWKRGPERKDSFSLLKIAEKIMKRRYEAMISPLELPRIYDKPILDIGCGLGRTLCLLRQMGYKNIKGIDYSEESVRVCREQGFDVSLMDARHTSFKDGEFSLVFSEGLLEHYKDFTALTKEMARISNQYICIVQPNHFSFLGRIRSLFTGKNELSPPELSYRIEEFYDIFKGFAVRFDVRLSFNNYALLMFDKKYEKAESQVDKLPKMKTFLFFLLSPFILIGYSVCINLALLLTVLESIRDFRIHL